MAVQYIYKLTAPFCIEQLSITPSPSAVLEASPRLSQTPSPQPSESSAAASGYLIARRELCLLTAAAALPHRRCVRPPDHRPRSLGQVVGRPIVRDFGNPPTLLATTCMYVTQFNDAIPHQQKSRCITLALIAFPAPGFGALRSGEKENPPGAAGSGQELTVPPGRSRHAV